MLRALIERRRSELVIAALAVAVAMIQAREIFGFHHVDYSRLIDPHIIRVAMDKFAGYIFASPRYGNYYSGPILLVLLGMAIWRIRDRLTRAVRAAGAHLGRRSCATTVLRNPIGVIDPLNGGPRYFFYPFTTMMWILIWIAALSPAYVRILLAGRIPAGDRLGVQAHDAQSRRGGLARPPRGLHAISPNMRCRCTTTGVSSRMWHVWLTGEQCRDLIARSLIRR